VSAKWLGNVSWRDALAIGVPVLALVALAFWIASRFVEPAPPNHLVMATGAPGGTYQRYGEQYRRYLEPYGVTLELRPSSGSVQNFAWLRDGKVDVAFVQGGEAEPAPAEAKGEPPVVSLGALYYEAMWVFQATGGAPADRLAELKGKRLAVGIDGSGTQSMALHLLRESGIDAGNTKLLRIGGADMLKALDAREVDAVFQVSGVEAPVLADLLRRRDLTLMSLVHAPAYAKRHAKLTALTVPRGVVDIEADLPPRDVSIIAVTANLLARNEVHPALMYLLLDTAVTVNSGHARLAEAGTFPNARGQDVPMADEAQRYYKSGKPFLQRYLPYWAANFVDRMLILLLPIFAVLIPAIKLAPVLYNYRLNARIVRGYAQLGAVESELSRGSDPARSGEYLARLDAIEAEIAAARLPKWFGEQAYLLRAAIELVRVRLVSPEAKATPGLRDRLRGGEDPGAPARPAHEPGRQ
jgi:TRAP transporter TAXI family solute receptor